MILSFFIPIKTGIEPFISFALKLFTTTTFFTRWVFKEPNTTQVHGVWIVKNTFDCFTYWTIVLFLMWCFAVIPVRTELKMWVVLVSGYEYVCMNECAHLYVCVFQVPFGVEDLSRILFFCPKFIFFPRKCCSYFVNFSSATCNCYGILKE